ncbi:MAG: DNA gyrase subunit A [Phycisphaeraceae bacterium]|nr:MAG: DNA gyrase subunit A [Phycisphaeraceae bacterium]
MPDQDRPTTPNDPSDHAPLDPASQGPDGLPSGGRVLDQDIQRELQDSYLTYAMSTIMDRALPDVRDGLKPSQRRLLWGMHELKLRPGRKHVKCAKVVGEVMGNYHPHGDSALYGTLVFMGQPWRMRVTLADPQGNFGSILGDPPAAMRYTEVRMSHAAAEMLADVELDTVAMQKNYDGTRDEPTVLPSRLPNLLINGGMGIAVGMATSLPPHNPTEILDAIIRVVENPAVQLAELMQDVTDESGAIVRHGVKGPDFPTGGTILGRRGIVDAYTTGRGKITIRGSCRVEPMEGKGDRQQIVIDTIPYMLSQTALVEKIVEAVEEGKIADISNINDESGRDTQTRIVIELKRGADPRVVEKQLYEFTPLQDTFSIQNLALVNRQPRTLSLREMIDCFIAHRRDVIRRRTSFLLREARKKAHVLEGMIYAVCDIDEVIRLIRASRTREEAIVALMERRFRIPSTHPAAAGLPARLKARLAAAEAAGGVALSRIQAETIGSMRLIQLVGLEIERLVADYRAVSAEIDDYESILASDDRVHAIIRDDCREIRDRLASTRRTAIDESDAGIEIAELIPRHDVALTISREGYVKRVPLDTYRQQGRGGKGIRAGESREDDHIEHLFVAGSHDDLLCFTDTGRVFRIKVYEVPEMSRTSKGRAIVNLIDLKPCEKCRAFLPVKNFESGGHFLTFASRQGIVKRTALKDYRNVNKGGIIAVGLKDGDSLLDVTLTEGHDDIMLVTAQGMAIRFNEDDARLMGRSAAGVKGIDLVEGDEVISVVAIPMTRDNADDLGVTRDPSLCLLTLTENGYGKRTPIDEYRVQPENGPVRSQSRGGKGRADIQTTPRNGRSIAALLVHARDDLVVMSKDGQLVRMPAGSIRECGRGTLGVRVVSLHEGDKAVAASIAPPQPDDPAPASPDQPMSPTPPDAPAPDRAAPGDRPPPAGDA